MNLKNLVREALLKKPKRKYDYGCVMVDLDLDTEEWNKIQEMIDEDDIYFGEKDNEGFGRELDPHATVLFGIHEDVPDADVEKILEKVKEPDVELEKVTTFNNELFDVLKFDIKSKDLTNLNKMFKELPHTSSFPNYHAHATICYCRKDTAHKYVKKLNEYFNKAGSLKVKPKHILYSKPDGTKKKYKLHV